MGKRNILETLSIRRERAKVRAILQSAKGVPHPVLAARKEKVK